MSHSAEIVESKRTADRLLWMVFGASVIIALMTLLLSLLSRPELPQNVGPMYPRTPAPPQAMRMDEMLRVMGVASLTWYACILSAPLFILLGRRFSFTRRRWPISLAVHLAVIILLVLTTSYLQHAFTYAGAPTRPPLDTYLQAALLTGFAPFIGVAAAAHALDARNRERQRELEVARANSQLAEARLAALTAQMQPHFLFNTLQGISALIPRDAAAADRMLANLSDLLREVLRRGVTHEVTVEEELRVLEPYLEISRARFGERLHLQIDVDATVRRARLPFFILQPLVENALAHGIGQHAGAGTVRVHAARANDRLVVAVMDNGTGNGVTTGTGIGLSNLRARLDALYGDDYRLDAAPVNGGGFEVHIDLPWREAE